MMNKFDFVAQLGGVYTTEQLDVLTTQLAQYIFTKKELCSLKVNQVRELARVARVFGWWYMNKAELVRELAALQ